MKSDQLVVAVVGILGALAGVLLTWLLKEVADTFKLTYQDRQIKGQALADLLEIRHRILAPSRAMKAILERMKLHPGEEAQLRLEWSNSITSVLADNADLKTRFNKTVDGLAGSVPVLSFQLRSKDSLLLVSDWIRGLSTFQPAAYQLVEPALEKMIKEIDSNLASFCRSLAFSHGVCTWCKVVWLIWFPPEIPIGLEKALADLRKIIADSRSSTPPQ